MLVARDDGLLRKGADRKAVQVKHVYQMVDYNLALKCAK